jgi:hypothetical protein
LTQLKYQQLPAQTMLATLSGPSDFECAVHANLWEHETGIGNAKLWLTGPYFPCLSQNGI